MRKVSAERLVFLLLGLLTASALAILVAVLLLLLVKAGSFLRPELLFRPWHPRDIANSGLSQAVVGTLILGLGTAAVSFPLGLATAVYLTEFSRRQTLQRVIRLTVRNLAGVPSVVFGLFGLALFVRFLSLGPSLLSAILTLSLMALPWVVTASVEALENVPKSFRASSAALGATPWQTLLHVTLPAALPGCLTGAILGMARAMGETAPILLVGAAFYLSRSPRTLLDPFMALPYHTFVLATQHASPLAPQLAAASAFVLIGATFVLSLAGITIRYIYRKRRDW